MRTVGRVLLVFVLAVGALSGGTATVTDAHPAAADPRSQWADDGPPTARGVGAGFHDPSGSDQRLGSTRAVGVERRALDGRVPPTAPRTGPRDDRATSTADRSAASLLTDGSHPGVLLVQEFRLTPARPGTVRVTHNFTLADRIAGIETTVPQRGTVTTTRGFTAENETVYRWDGRTPSPSITYSLPINETGARSYAAANGSLLFADTGEWALFRRPVTSTIWRAFGTRPVRYERRVVTVGPGAAGDALVFLGDVTLHPRTAHNQTFRLAVPAAANMTATPDEVLDAMERASGDLAVGDRDAAVFAVAAPTDGVPWAVRGLSVGDADFWVEADERLATTENIWIHEYVHTRQDYRPTATTEWTTEGFASYYAARQALKYQSVTFDEFAASLARGANVSANTTLADPATWRNGTSYERGALVAGQFDRRIRLASGGEATLDSVLAAMNRDTGTLNASEYFAAVDATGNESVRRTLRSAVYTDRPVAMWNRSRQVAAFGTLPARFVYGLPRGIDPSAYRVRGPYRNASLVGTSEFTVVTGESFVVTANVYNAGNSSGVYDAALRVNGTVVDTAEGTLDAGATGKVPLDHTFRTPGEYTVAVGNDTATVEVRRPATAAVVGVRVRPGAIEQYGTATVSVTVRNDSPLPGRRAVRIRRESETVLERTVRVGPKSTTTIRTRIQLPNAGTIPITVAGVGTVEIVVDPVSRPQPRQTPVADSTPTETPSGAVGQGTGSIAALFAFLAAVLVARHLR